MNYLTNYYRNLSEQLQERVNYLQFLLNEALEEETDDNKKESMKFGEGEIISSDKKTSDSTEETASDDKKVMKLGKGAVISGGPVKGLTDIKQTKK